MSHRDLYADLRAQFPGLTDSNHRVTSQPTGAYNCVAWVDRDTATWFEPGFNWPEDLLIDEGQPDLDAYQEFFRRKGFENCESPDQETGFLKIALYAVDGFFHHVAKQLASGAWSSKNGRLHDIRHDDLAALEGAGVLANAAPAVFMKRKYDGADMPLEETGLLMPGDA